MRCPHCQQVVRNRESNCLHCGFVIDLFGRKFCFAFHFFSLLALLVAFFLVLPLFYVSFPGGLYFTQNQKLGILVFAVLYSSSCVCSTIFQLMTLEKGWKIVQVARNDDHRWLPTSGMAIGYLFIPILGFFWKYIAYYLLASRLNDLSVRRGYVPLLRPKLYLAACIFCDLSTLLLIFLSLFFPEPHICIVCEWTFTAILLLLSYVLHFALLRACSRLHVLLAGIGDPRTFQLPSFRRFDLVNQSTAVWLAFAIIAAGWVMVFSQPFNSTVIFRDEKALENIAMFDSHEHLRLKAIEHLTDPDALARIANARKKTNSGYSRYSRYSSNKPSRVQEAASERWRELVGETPNQQEALDLLEGTVPRNEAPRLYAKIDDQQQLARLILEKRVEPGQMAKIIARIDDQKLLAEIVKTGQWEGVLERVTDEALLAEIVIASKEEIIHIKATRRISTPQLLAKIEKGTTNEAALKHTNSRWFGVMKESWDQKTAEFIAKNARSPWTRAIATQKLDNLPIIAEIMQDEANKSEMWRIENHFYKVFEKVIAEEPPERQREIISELLQVPNAAVPKSIFIKITDQAVLSTIALNDPNEKTRIAAFRQIDDANALLQFYQQGTEEKMLDAVVLRLLDVAPEKEDDKEFIKMLALDQRLWDGRIAAIRELPAEEIELLKKIATEVCVSRKDKKSTPAAAAVLQISDWNVLCEIASGKYSSSAKIAADRRLVGLVDEITDQKELEKLALNHKRYTVRRAAVKKMTNRALLSKIALRDKSSLVRSAAYARSRNLLKK